MADPAKTSQEEDELLKAHSPIDPNLQMETDERVLSDDEGEDVQLMPPPPKILPEAPSSTKNKPPKQQQVVSILRDPQGLNYTPKNPIKVGQNFRNHRRSGKGGRGGKSTLSFKERLARGAETSEGTSAKSTPTKRDRSNSPSPTGISPKAKKQQPPQKRAVAKHNTYRGGQTDIPSNSLDFKQAVVTTNIMVTYVEDGHKRVTNEDLEKVKLAIEEKILEQIMTGSQPVPLHCGNWKINDEGRIVAPCHDEASETFIIQTIPLLLDGKFKTWRMQDFPPELKRKTYSGFLEGAYTNNETLIKVLHNQNPTLCANQWHVVGTSKGLHAGTMGTYIWFSIPEGSIEALRKIGFKPYYLARQFTMLRSGFKLNQTGPKGGPTGK